MFYTHEVATRWCMKRNPRPSSIRVYLRGGHPHHMLPCTFLEDAAVAMWVRLSWRMMRFWRDERNCHTLSGAQLSRPMLNM